MTTNNRAAPGLRRPLMPDPAEFVEVICRDTELLHREFDDIIAAEWPTETLQPPRAETLSAVFPSDPQHRRGQTGGQRSRGGGRDDQPAVNARPRHRTRQSQTKKEVTNCQAQQ